MSVAIKPAPDLYETDYAEWSERQAALLRARRFADIDLDNVAEEIESLGRSNRRALRSQLTQLVMHLLKWRQQRERRSQSWRNSIRNARDEINVMLRESPSLGPYFATLWPGIDQGAMLEAADDMALAESALPSVPPFTLEQCLDRSFWPD